MKHNNFTNAKTIPFEEYKSFNKIEKLITQTKDELLLDDLYRMLAFLMQNIIIKQKKIYGIKKIKPYKLLKKFKFFDKEGFGGLNKNIKEIYDHVYAEKYKDLEILFLEPYNFSKEDMENLLKHCDENNLNCWVSGQAEHFPNKTIKIGLLEIKDEKSNLN